MSLVAALRPKLLQLLVLVFRHCLAAVGHVMPEG